MAAYHWRGDSKTVTEIIGTAQITGAAELVNAYLSGGFLADFVTVIAANLALSGDNAVIIALAALTLPPSKRPRGIFFGTIAAVFARVLVACLPATFLNAPCMRLSGAFLVLVIALKLIHDNHSPGEEQERTPAGLTRAIVMILLADLAMSPDNILAVASAGRGNPALAFLGLSVSIPVVAFGGDIVARLMQRCPAAVYAGAAILGKIAADMVLADPLILRFLHAPGPEMRYGTETIIAVGVVVAGMFLAGLREMRHPPLPASRPGPFYVGGWDMR